MKVAEADIVVFNCPASDDEHGRNTRFNAVKGGTFCCF